MPASARIYAPEQTLAIRTPRFSIARTKLRVFSHVAAVRTPQPPATIKVVIAPAGLMPRASISAPDELRTAPGVNAITLIDGGLPAERAAISNTEIGPAASSNWKSGKISTPIMLAPMSVNEGNMAFETSSHHGRMTSSSQIGGITMSAPLQIGLLVFPKVTQLDF